MLSGPPQRLRAQQPRQQRPRPQLTARTGSGKTSALSFSPTAPPSAPDPPRRREPQHTAGRRHIAMPQPALRASTTPHWRASKNSPSSASSGASAAQERRMIFQSHKAARGGGETARAPRSDPGDRSRAPPADRARQLRSAEAPRETRPRQPQRLTDGPYPNAREALQRVLRPAQHRERQRRQLPDELRRVHDSGDQRQWLAGRRASGQRGEGGGRQAPAGRASADADTRPPLPGSTPPRHRTGAGCPSPRAAGHQAVSRLTRGVNRCARRPDARGLLCRSRRRCRQVHGQPTAPREPSGAASARPATAAE